MAVMPSITPAEVAHLARLSRLALSEAELEAMAGQLDVIINSVARVSEVAGVSVLELDRLTWAKLDDAELARSGVPQQSFKGKVPYTNQNDKITFTIPVADSARILYHHCVAADQPLQTRSAPVKELAGLDDRENTVVVGLDDQGRLTTADNIAGCPG